jgi:hypothetical protein
MHWRCVGGTASPVQSLVHPLNRLIALLGRPMRTRPQDPINTVIGANRMSALQLKMSALPPKADMCDAKTNVR